MRSQCIIKIADDRLDVYRINRRQCTHHVNRAISLPSDAAEWSDAVRQLHVELRELLSAMASDTPREAIVLYRSPTSVSDVVSVPIHSPAAAIEAAELECIDGLPFSAYSAVIDSYCIGRDQGTESDKTHVAVTADRNDVTQALYDLVEQCGLRVRSITPIDGTLSIALGQEMLEHRGKPNAMLYIGETASYFLAGSCRALLFERRLSFGIASLIAALQRPIHSASDKQNAKLCKHDAEQLLGKYGIPERSSVVHESLGLTGADVVPLMLPNLQRFLVELRQTLRFGVGEKSAEMLPMSIVGPGASINGLREIIAAEMGEQITVQDAQTANNEYLSSMSDVAYLVQQRDALRTTNLLPLEVNQQRRVVMATQCLWAGGIAALLLVGSDALRHEARLQDAKMQADAIAAHQTDREMLQETSGRMIGVLQAAQNLRLVIDEELTARPAMHALLYDLSGIAKDPIRLVAMSVDSDGPELHGYITGTVNLNTVDGAADVALEQFIGRMRESALIASTDLMYVQKSSNRDADGLQFEINFVAKRSDVEDAEMLQPLSPRMQTARGGER